MSIVHHPSDLLLAEFVSGALNEAASLVVAGHLAHCSRCRELAHGFECVGGVLLEEVTPVDAGVAAHAIVRDAIVADVAIPDRAERADDPLEAIISLYDSGDWRWIGPGVWRREIVLRDRGMRAFMLKAQPGTQLPEHSHTGSEITLVLKGDFTHERGCYRAGDLEEADGDVAHAPVVGTESECICLVAMEGNIRMHGLLGRLMQPFVRL